MAGGGKETPRQKMVGMMYLVLTALLALQVSNAVLDKFMFIDESLQNSKRIARENNGLVLKGIEAKATETGRAYDKAVHEQGVKIKKLTDDAIAEVQAARNAIIDQMGGKDDTGKYPSAKDYDKVMAIMLGPEGSNSGIAYDMKPKLNKFVADIKALDTAFKALPDKIAKEPAEMEMYKDDADQKSKSWEFINFDHTPMVAALAVLSQIENEIAKVETKAMEATAAKIGADMVKFDEISAKVVAESRQVAAGTKYKATMFLAAGASNITPKYTCSAGSVKVNEQREGEIEFTASGGTPGYGKIDKTWKGSISFRAPTGDTTFTVEEEYTVVEPIIKVEAAAVQALYLKCGNELNVQVPALGTTYDPSFTATGAKVIPGKKKGMVTLVPNGANVTLNVSSGGNKIGSRKFKVRLVPKPDIIILNGKKPINEKQGGRCPRSLKAVAEADKDFKTFLPKDARYRVNKWKVTLARGRRGMGTETANGPTANISRLASDARDGDRLVIEVEGVQRLNFQNQTEKVNVGTVIKTYPINM